MSATTASSNTNAAAYLPPPPQAVANTPTPQQQMDSGNEQFNALLKLISGGARSHKRGCRCKVCSSRRSKRKSVFRSRSTKRSRRSSRRRYTQRRYRRRRRSGGTTTTAQPLTPQKIEVSTVPAKGPEVSYPSATDMQVKLAATIAQNGANASMDNTTKSVALSGGGRRSCNT
jgi:hypothetical protein